mmetsp:Transcript_150454/g.273808  ORF Transcript_150454/g.273808 Transcript_150454/m.273808 type:complete len:417 (-) Transcript_150454:3-1253(-)
MLLSRHNHALALAALVLAYLPCLVHGRRVQSWREQLRSSKGPKNSKLMKADGSASGMATLDAVREFARLLFLSQVPAFHHSGLAGHARTFKPLLLSPHRQQGPVMDAQEQIHSWFDPLQRWGYDVPERPNRPLLAYIPGLDGSNGSPFVQFPGLAKQFELAVQDVNCESRALNAAGFEDVVDDVASYLRSCGREKRFILGESYGGLVAVGVALRHPGLVSGLILVNPATAVSGMPQLQEDIEWVRFGGIPDPLVTPAILSKVGWKTFDVAFLGNAVRDIFIEKKMEKLRAMDPALAAYYDTALADFTQQLSGLKPADYWRGRLAQLDEGIQFVEPKLRSLELPVLVVAGTGDNLLTSEKEAARLASMLPDCDKHLVVGAGHAGTLDQRVDLPAVISEWASKRGLAVQPAVLDLVKV